MSSNRAFRLNLGIAMLIALVAAGTSSPARAQEEAEEKTPLEIEAEEAKLRGEIAESKLKAAKAKKELEELDLADSSFEPVKAGLSVKDKAGYYGELLSFTTLEAAAAEFVGSVAEAVPAGSRIVVTSDYEFSKAGALWHLVDGKLGDFENAFPSQFLKLPPPSAPDQELLGPAAALLTSTLGAASEVAAFFRVKREMAGREVEPSTESLIALVVKQLLANGYKPLLPQLVVKYDTKLAQRIDGIRALQKGAEARKNQRQQELKGQPIGIDIDKAAQEIAEIKKKLKADPNNTELKARLAKLGYYKKWWDESSRSLDQVRAAFGKLMVRLETVPEKATQSPIELLYAYESLIDENASVLLAQAVSQGADVETSSGALRRTKISYVGGSASLFYLSDVKGTVLAADVIPIVASQSFTGRIGTRPSRRVQ